MKIVTQARTWLGTKYHHQGRLKKGSSLKSGQTGVCYKGGVDCIGLIMGVAAELKLTGEKGAALSEFDRFDYSALPDGKSLPEFLNRHFIKVDIDKIQNGDVLLFKIFKDPQHIGISTVDKAGNLGLIHCYSGSGKVVEHLLSPAWLRMIIGCYRFRDI